MVPSLSSLTPFYTQASHSTKVSIDVLHDWILKNLMTTEEDQVGPSKTQLPSKIEYVSLLNKAVTMRDAANLPDGKDVRIS
jgi:hypothetical protein